jgi:hypothetical protein
VGGAQRRVRLRRAPARFAARGVSQLKAPGLGIDGAVVPALLLLVARDLSLYDPPRVLAWRLAHDERIAAAFVWLGPLRPAPSGAWDRDPIARCSPRRDAAGARLRGDGRGRRSARPWRDRARGARARRAAERPFVAMGVASERSYGQDGYVV